MSDRSGPVAGPRNVVAPADAPGLSGLATMAVGIVVVLALYFGQEVFVPIVLAVLLSFVLAPLASLLRKLRIGRTFSVIAAVLLALGFILAIGSVLGLQVAQLAGQVPRYQAAIERKVDRLQEGTIGNLSALLQRIGQRMESQGEPQPAPEAPASSDQQAGPRPLPVEVHTPAPTALQIARNIIGPVVHPLATIGIVLVVAIFLLLQREDLRDRLIRLFGSGDLHRTTVAMDDAARRLSRYFLAQVGLAGAYGVFIGLCLWALGVPAPILWGLLAALMRFVPYVGGFIAAAPPLALAAAVDPGWTTALIVLGLFVAAEAIMGNVVEPLFFGRSTGLSPFAVIVSTIFWTWLWGPIGLVLATPLTVCLVVLGSHVDRLEFLDVLLGDRPALTPPESFYQRMLAGDPDEVLDSAEVMLHDRSLSSYYDEVALKGLQLAANDAERGVLTDAQLNRIRGAIDSLIGDLATHDDVDPTAGAPAAEAEPDNPLTPPGRSNAPEDASAPEGGAPAAHELPPSWRGPAPVMCIAGRGRLDEAASSMLAQLLEKHGLGARVVPHEAVSRAGINTVDVTGVAMVCISYLEIAGSPAHLRYLLRRLRQRLPGVPLLVGLWPAGEAILSDPALRAQVGADYYVTSLREGVEACLQSARKAAEPEGTPSAAAA